MLPPCNDDVGFINILGAYTADYNDSCIRTGDNTYENIPETLICKMNQNSDLEDNKDGSKYDEEDNVRGGIRETTAANKNRGN